jgi:hypothetical protein
MSRNENGFTLVEAAVAAFLVVVFFMAFASSVDIASDNSRANRFNQQATVLASAEVDYARVLLWEELAMSGVEAAQPMLDESRTHLLASEAGLAADEALMVDSEGSVDPVSIHTTDGQDYTVWHYVTDAGDSLKRLVVLVVWHVEGTQHTFQTSTLISEVTAGSGTTTPFTTTTSPGGGSSTTTSPTSTTTTTQPTGVLTVYKLSLKLNEGKSKIEVEVTVKDGNGNKVQGVTVIGRYSVSPSEAGYPFSVSGTTDSKGEVEFTHNDSFDDETMVEFCVTDLQKAGYAFDGNVECDSEEWDD